MNSRPLFIATSALFTALIAGCTSNDSAPTAPIPIGKAITPVGSTNFTPRGQGFTIYFPSKPAETHKKIALKSEDYEDVAYHSTTNHIHYYVLIQPIPSELARPTPQAMLDFFESGYTRQDKKHNNKLVRRQAISLNGLQGRELLLNMHNGLATSRVRMYVMPKKIYQVMAVGLKQPFVAQKPQVDKVFDSFRFTEQ